MRWLALAVVIGCGGTETPPAKCCVGAAYEKDNLLVFSDPTGGEVRATECGCTNGQMRRFPSSLTCEQVQAEWTAWACR